MMKKVFSILFITLFTVSFTTAQDCEEIIDNYLEAIGGTQAWKDINSMEITGKMTMQGMDLNMKVYTLRPDMSYAEIDVMGKTIIQAFDGETAWNVNPFMGGTDPVKGTEEETEEAKKEKFENDFIDYKEKGSTVELLGSGEVEGVDCYKIKLTTKEGDESIYYFDKESYVPIMVQSTISSGPMEGKIAETYFSDYDEVVDGVYMPFFTETKMDGKSVQKMTIEEVKVNTEIDASIFKFPSK